jgi:hypothetical protein
VLIYTLWPGHRTIQVDLITSSRFFLAASIVVVTSRARFPAGLPATAGRAVITTLRAKGVVIIIPSRSIVAVFNTSCLRLGMVTCIAFQHLASIVVIFHKQNPGTQFVAILVPWGSADWPGAVYPASTSPATPSWGSVIASGSQVHNSGSLYMDVGTPTTFSNHQHYRRRRWTRHPCSWLLAPTVIHWKWLHTKHCFWYISVFGFSNFYFLVFLSDFCLACEESFSQSFTRNWSSTCTNYIYIYCIYIMHLGAFSIVNAPRPN